MQLLGAFFPGYCLAIIPAAAAATAFGGKAILNTLLFGQALLLGAMPLAARGRGQAAVYRLSATMAVVGVLQGPLIPGLAPMERQWIPAGPSRALALRIPHLGM